MRRMPTLATVCCLTITLTFAGRLPAADIFNNFGPGDTFQGSGLILQGEAVGNIGNVDQAAAFSTGATDVAVTDIRLGIYVSSPDNSPFDGRGPLDVILAQDSGGKPGAALATIPLNVNAYLGQIVHASVPGTLLSANTQYWVIADAKGTFDGAWESNSINDFGPTAGRSDNGPWNLHGPNTERFAFSVQGRLVPEPSTFLLAALAGVGLLGGRMRRLRIR